MRLWIAFVVLCCISCETVQTVFEEKKTRYENYLFKLEQAELLNKPLGIKWVEAGESALLDFLEIELPYSATGFLTSTKPEALSYQFDAVEGQSLEFNTTFQTEEKGQIFIDLYAQIDTSWVLVQSSDSTHLLDYEFRESRSYLIRIQPELLIDVHYSVSIGVSPILSNPVIGANDRSIWSLYGDPRDGGRRKHEGIDIFAKRGTPIIAPTAGRITYVGDNHRGGKVVWMKDDKRNLAYYFAHLDSQMVSSAQIVALGDTIGTVGNTGNARTTPPHLHFGIYRRGSTDPLPFVKKTKIKELMSIDTSEHSQIIVTSAEANIRQQPSGRASLLYTLDKNELTQNLGKSGQWFHVKADSFGQGFVHESLVAVLDVQVADSLHRNRIMKSHDIQ